MRHWSRPPLLWYHPANLALYAQQSFTCERYKQPHFPQHGEERPVFPVAGVADGRVLLDLRSVPADADSSLIVALRSALAP